MAKQLNIIARIRKALPPSVKKRSTAAWAGAFLFSIFFILINVNTGRDGAWASDEFEEGKVADRDVIAEHTIIYEDEQATLLRKEAEEKLVPAVFHYTQGISDEIRDRWSLFADLAGSSYESVSEEEYIALVQSSFPGVFPDGVLNLLYHADDPAEILHACTVILNAILDRGVYSMSPSDLGGRNPDMVELIRIIGTRVEQELISQREIITPNDVDRTLAELSSGRAYPPLFLQLGPALVKPFLRENVFYSPVNTAQRVFEATAKVEPVMKRIEQGERIIKRGFIITDADIDAFIALRMNLSINYISIIFADIIFLLLIYGFLWFFSGRRIIGRDLSDREIYLISFLSFLYIAGSVLVRKFPVNFMPVSVIVPTALIIMLPSILIHPRLALLLAFALPLGAFSTGSFDSYSFVFAIVSGVVAAYSLQKSEKRMDLVKAGLIIAAVNFAAMAAVLLWQRSPASIYLQALFWAAFNGIASGMLVLGFLPPLEHALNAATTFRLIELSDLNTPILKRLFSAAPGTYSHSIMVASLAETACNDIGARPLLARVGAYYHDLGKMENPAYFVENQTDYNRHDDLSPRLSATVVRSHVKLGVEKARQLGLPQEVIDIISEHHGNSVISWFYNKALKQEGMDVRKAAVEMEDFAYPGSPPRSRESAVVMLADVSEAAVRTLEKPTAVKIERFIQELIAQKIERGQLSRSELTFRDLETIKNSFVRVLVGHYHSRIEYPKTDAQKNIKEDENGDISPHDTNEVKKQNA